MVIIPDDKDWTWVLSRPCHECGFTAQEVTPASAGTTIPALLPRWQAALKRANVEERPDPATWSVLEYGAHVRDVFEVFTARLELLLSQDNPTFATWDQDQAALEGGYAQLDPEQVSVDLVQNGLDAAAAFGAAPLADWQRHGLRSDGAPFTVVTLAGYFLHELVHHLHDIDG